uniref:Uncharacterized protein n=1 Tax=Octopus bimaculoides TaxID=37653 RepID=A0A0L8H620_OCTBM
MDPVPVFVQCNGLVVAMLVLPLLSLLLLVLVLLLLWLLFLFLSKNVTRTAEINI